MKKKVLQKSLENVSVKQQVIQVPVSVVIVLHINKANITGI